MWNRLSQLLIAFTIDMVSECHGFSQSDGYIYILKLIGSSIQKSIMDFLKQKQVAFEIIELHCSIIVFIMN